MGLTRSINDFYTFFAMNVVSSYILRKMGKMRKTVWLQVL